MALYNYEKYNLKLQYYADTSYTTSSSVNSIYGYSGVTVNPDTGACTFGGVDYGYLDIADAPTSTQMWDSSTKKRYKKASSSSMHFTETGKVSSQNIKGTYVSTVQAEDGTYPDNGESNGYWYVKTTLAWTPPNLKTKINGSAKSYSDGWVKVGGVLRKIDSVYIKVNGVVKKV